MRKSCFIGFILLLAVTGCEKKSKSGSPMRQFPNDGTGLPLPRFDADYDQFLISMEEEFNAEDVQISRPFEFNWNNKPEHWLKVSLVSPDIPQVGDDSFGLFANRVAATVYRHLTNADKFKKLEISVEQNIRGFNSIISKVIYYENLKPIRVTSRGFREKVFFAASNRP